MAIKRCKSPFSVWINRVPRVITGGQLIEDTDPVYKTHAEYFEDVETFVSESTARASRVEQATAAPGEKRSVSVPGPFDPAAQKADEVIAYLGGVDRDEALRVLDAEAAGKKRSTVLALREQFEAPADTSSADPGDGA